LVGVQVTETLEVDHGCESGRDTSVRRLVVGALHVAGEGLTGLPAADHDDLAVVAVRMPDLEIDEPISAVD
jgi:hypothetical protein